MMKEKTFCANGLTLNYAESESEGPPVLILHGLSGNWRVFLPIIPMIAQTHKVYAMDLRGHGNSEHVGDEYAFLDYAVDVVEFLNEISRTKTILIGHSTGAVTSLIAAAKAPAKVAAIAVFDPPLMSYEALMQLPAITDVFPVWSDVSTQGQSAENIRKLLGWSNPLQFQKALDFLRMDPSALDFSTNPFNFDVEKTLRSISCAVLLVYGDKERGGVLTVEQAEELKSKIRDCTLYHMPAAGHVSPNECIIELNQFLNGF
jgi:pimeloyl-ACP methyl ester carboxylesterase